MHPQKKLLAALIKDLNNILKAGSLYGVKIFKHIKLSKGLKEIINLAPKGKEDMVYLNRLLMEAAFAYELSRVEVRVEMVVGKWLGLEDVKMYRGLVVFKGAESFKVFHRRIAKKASSLMIPLNAMILVVARPLHTVKTVRGELVWLLEALHIRMLR